MSVPKFNHFLYEETDGIAIFTANRPEVMNALNSECQADILHFAEFIEETDRIRVAILTGAGDKAFIAGADINNIKTAEGISSLNSRLRRGLDLLESSSKPVIGAINGYALGGGCETALACDIRIASENAVFGLPETGLGVLPGAGGTQRLASIVGVGVAKDMILGGRYLTAQDAYQQGLVMKVVPQSELMNQAVKLAKKIIAKGPVALSIAKKMINASMYTDRKTGVFMESLGLAVLFESEDKFEGASAFLEKRTPVFKGR
jgi:enoyl-CoA hydratase